MDIKTEFWGEVKNQKVFRYTIRNSNGMELELSNFGALVLGIRIPIDGKMRDVALELNCLESYLRNVFAFGAFIGRNCNRVSNAQVCINGTTYKLKKNNPPHNLHSGMNCSYYQIYQAEEKCFEDKACVEFSRLSPHLEQGFPGNLEQKIRYTLTDTNSFEIEYFMKSDKATVINPTNHCYFNLMGQNSDNILEHKLMICSDKFLPVDNSFIPTGEIACVENTPMDFTKLTTIKTNMYQDFEQLKITNGYDHCFCLSQDGELHKAAELHSDDERVTMTVSTDRPGVQIYTAYPLNNIKGKYGKTYRHNAGICFETEAYPNACNEPNFPSSIVDAGTEFHSKTIYHFDWKDYK